jgi:oxygen-independent coproporphyrinogen-3 oxidase
VGITLKIIIIKAHDTGFQNILKIIENCLTDWKNKKRVKLQQLSVISMAGIYLHIPFCRNACYYCDFHLTTDPGRSKEMIMAMAREIILRKDYLGGLNISTIYFGGGTPSFIKYELICILLETILKNFKIGKDPEITLEANPEDIKSGYLSDLLKIGINRISIGVQSFFDDDLRFMNRVHNAAQAIRSIKEARNAGFKNINLDLIYGIPGLTEKKWIKNIETAIDFHVEHLSAYHLTYEPSTVLYYRKIKNRFSEISEKESIKQFSALCEKMKSAQYIHYEISNFAKDGYYSKHNSGYWKQVPYIGIGPSAHSYNGKSRQWNFPRNMSYIRAINNDGVFYETEVLDQKERYHDYIMTTLRTIWGTDKEFILKEFGQEFYDHFVKSAAGFIKSGELVHEKGIYYLTDRGMWISDFIVRKLFI